MMQGSRGCLRIGSILSPQQTVDPLQLTLVQDETVDLLLTARTRYHDSTHQHRVGLLLLLCLQRRCVPVRFPLITLEGMDVLKVKTDFVLSP